METKTNTLVDAAYDAAYKLDVIVFNNATKFKRQITQEAVSILATAKARQTPRREWLQMILNARPQFALAFTTGSLARYKADVTSRHDISEAQMQLDTVIVKMLAAVTEEYVTYEESAVKKLQLGIIGTYEPAEASLEAWEAMLQAGRNAITSEHVTLLSGGSAWADHVAVVLFNERKVSDLHLYLPAKWETTDKYLDTGMKGYKTNPGGFLNKKHEEFSTVIDRNSLAQIGLAKTNGAVVFDSYADPSYRYTAIASLCDQLLVLGTTPTPSPVLETIMNKCKDRIPVEYVNVCHKQNAKRKIEAEKSSAFMTNWLIKKPKV